MVKVEGRTMLGIGLNSAYRTSGKQYIRITVVRANFFIW
jgi:hypothetical protein